MFNIFNGLFVEEYLFFICDIFFILFVLILLCLSIFIDKHVKSLYISKLIIDLTIPIIIFSFFLSLNINNLSVLLEFSSFFFDSLYLFFKSYFFLFLFFCLIFSRNYFLYEKIHIYEYSLLLLLSVEGSFLLLMSYDLFIIYLALELQNLCFYVLASIKRYSSFSTEAGLKYFLLGAFSSSLFLFGVSIVYGIFGTLNLFDISFIIEFYEVYSSLLFISIFFLLSGLIFKLGGAPFHWWIPDVYSGSPTVVTMFFSLMPKLVYVFIFFKLFFLFFVFDYNFVNFLFIIIGISSLIVGIVNAMYQYRLKRFLAYSAIANVGYLFLSFSLSSFFGFFSSIFFIISYMVTVCLIFMFLLSYRKNEFFEFIDSFELSLLSNYNIFVSLFVALIFLSFAGIPPLIGFFGKLFIFLSFAIEHNYIILFLVLLFSIISGFYYIRIIRFIFFNTINDNVLIFNISTVVVPFVLLSLLNLFFFFFFDIISEYLFFLIVQLIIV